MLPPELKKTMASGLRSFPVTDFRADAYAWVVGRDAGPVRPPLADPGPGESTELAALIESLGDQ